MRSSWSCCPAHEPGDVRKAQMKGTTESSFSTCAFPVIDTRLNFKNTAENLLHVYGLSQLWILEKHGMLDWLFEWNCIFKWI